MKKHVIDHCKPSPVVTYQLTEAERAAYNAKYGPIKEMPYRPFGNWEKRQEMKQEKSQRTPEELTFNGMKLREIRESKNITCEALGYGLCSKSTVANIEIGKQPCPRDRAEA